jgi:hypothetical protein
MVARKDQIAVPNWRNLHDTHEWIVQMYEAWSKPDEATEWKQH